MTTLGRAAYNVDDLSTYQAVALSVRDQLIQRWNATQTEHTQRKPKRIYYFSLEFLMGKSLDNALLVSRLPLPVSELEADPKRH